MKKIIYFFVLIIFSTKALAQTPQIALVNPTTGNTQIFTTFSNAYDAAQNDDYIYLPGGEIAINANIAKRLNIYGAGYHPAESIVTGKTTIASQLVLDDSATGTHIEGIDFTNNVGNSYALILNGCSNITVINCKMTYVISDSNSINCIFKNNIISGIRLNNSTIVNNIIAGGENTFLGGNIENNIFLDTFEYNGGYTVVRAVNSTISNNIFLSNAPVNYSGSYANCGNIFQNNLKLGSSPLSAGGSCSTNQSIESGTINANSIDDIFVNATSSFSFTNDYHLKPTSSGINAGADGTDVGIYGSSSPCPDIRIPSNPHIYLKNVGTQSTPEGKLQVHYGVKKGSQ